MDGGNEGGAFPPTPQISFKGNTMANLFTKKSSFLACCELHEEHAPCGVDEIDEKKCKGDCVRCLCVLLDVDQSSVQVLQS